MVPHSRASLATTAGASAILLIVSTPPTAAQQRADRSPPEQIQSGARDAVGVEQIGRPPEAASTRPNAVEQVDGKEKRPAKVVQLPGDAELPASAPGPENGLEQITRRSPRADLYQEVATVWELIRRRGQQPTPELIAREIGPDLLAKFLNTFPGSEGMFGVDSDQLPIKPPPDTSPPPDPED